MNHSRFVLQRRVEGFWVDVFQSPRQCDALHALRRRRYADCRCIERSPFFDPQLVRDSKIYPKEAVSDAPPTVTDIDEGLVLLAEIAMAL